MKKIVLSLLTIGTLIVTSCSSDPCAEKTRATTCYGNGTPTTSGSTCSCVCDKGILGTSCDSLSISTLVGTYDVSEISGTRTYNYVATVRLGTNYQLNIDSLAGYKTNYVVAKISKTNISIQKQDPNSGLPSATYVETLSAGNIKYNTTTGKAIISMTYRQTGSTGSTADFQCTMTQK